MLKSRMPMPSNEARLNSLRKAVMGDKTKHGYEPHNHALDEWKAVMGDKTKHDPIRYPTMPSRAPGPPCGSIYPQFGGLPQILLESYADASKRSTAQFAKEGG